MQATQETGAVIAVERLVKRYRREQHNAVDGLSFQVRRGEIFGFRATLEKLPGITKVELLSAQTDEQDGSHAVVFRLYASVDAGMLLANAAQTVIQEHGELLDLHVAQPSLEDVFIYLTGRKLRS